jgi:hypothetical protein
MELWHALAITIGEDSFDESNMPDEEDLPSVWAGLIYIEEGNELVRLAHSTVQDYVESIRDKKVTDARRLVAGRCLTYRFCNGNRLCHHGQHYIHKFSQDGCLYECIDDGKVCRYAGEEIYEIAKDISDSESNQDIYFYHDKNDISLARYRYAAHHWARHIKSHLEKSLKDLDIKFLLDDLNRRAALGAVRTLWWMYQDPRSTYRYGTL